MTIHNRALHNARANSIQGPTSVEAAIKLKVELLVNGVNVSQAVSKLRGYKEKIHGLYVHDRYTYTQVMRTPQELILYRDPNWEPNEAVVCNIRMNPHSPWNLGTSKEGEFELTHHDGRRYRVDLVPEPEFYHLTTNSGYEVRRVVQLLGLDLLTTIPNNFCAYYATNEQCRFCELVPSYLLSRHFPQPQKSVDIIAESIRTVLGTNCPVGYFIIATGNYHTYDETVLQMIPLLQETKDVRQGRVCTHLQCMPPDDLHLIDELRNAGLDAVAFNLEVWTPKLFATMAPGKARYGRGRLINALRYAVSVFGKGRVYSNLIYGLQSLNTNLDPASHDPEREYDLCIEATTALTGMGIVPYFTLYHTMGKNAIGSISLDKDAVLETYYKCGEIVCTSRVLADTARAIVFSLGSVANHPINEPFAIFRGLTARPG